MHENPTTRCHNCNSPRFEHFRLSNAKLACPKGGTTFFVPAEQAAGEEKPGGMNAWDKTIGDILDWQRKQFPDATEVSSLKHLKKEIAEVEHCLDKGVETIEEWADGFFMLLQAADRSPGANSLLVALRAKLDVNKFEREWNLADRDGIFHHKTPEDQCDHEKPRAACEICNPKRVVPALRGETNPEFIRNIAVKIDGQEVVFLGVIGETVHGKKLYTVLGVDQREFDLFLAHPEEKQSVYISPIFGTVELYRNLEFFSINKFND
jgi:hypothetical protein